MHLGPSYVGKTNATSGELRLCRFELTHLSAIYTEIRENSLYDCYNF